MERLARMAQPEPRRIDWGSAEIRDGTLTVELTGRPSKTWNRHFAGVLGLLESSGRQWGDVDATKKGIEIEEVQEGSEGDLRHLLESAVLEVNSQLELDSDERASASEGDPQRVADQRMTATFRAFAETDA
jgi:hypothetical protein